LAGTRCDGTTAFNFEKPVGFEFEAGPFASFTLLRPADSDLEGNSRRKAIEPDAAARALVIPGATAFSYSHEKSGPSREYFIQFGGLDASEGE
jgi:hypothetical protein